MDSSRVANKIKSRERERERERIIAATDATWCELKHDS